MMGMPSLQDGLGKYREIVVAVAFFLVFDMAVLILNFVISYQIADDALAINLAGRQRMLSQRMTKALLQVETAVLRNENPLKAVDELRQTVTVFSSTLQAFTYGGETVNAQGKPVELTKASEEKAIVALNSAYLLWTPYEKVLAPVLEGNVDHASLQPAVTYATKHKLDEWTDDRARTESPKQGRQHALGADSRDRSGADQFCVYPV
jgi:two-component system, chemotaxis family, sensor kinase CheA